MPIILGARPVRWVSLRHALLIVLEPVSSVIPTLAHTRGPGALNPVLMACHRSKRTEADPLCLLEIVVGGMAPW